MNRMPVTWDLESLYPRPDSEAFGRLLETHREELTMLAARSDRLPGLDDAAGWTGFLQAMEQVEARAGDLASLIGCYAAADAANVMYRQLEARLSALDPLRERVATNVEFALQEADDAAFQSLAAGSEWLRRNRFFLEERRRNAAKRLPKDLELLAADLNVDGLHAWGRLYDRLSGDLRIEVMERGERVEKSPSQVRLDSPERSVRQNNFYAAEKAWKTIADSCADALNHISGTRLTTYRRLGLVDHLEMPLHRNRMTRETLTAMWAAIGDRKGMLVPYLRKKAELLGLERLAWYDLQAPLPAMPQQGESSEIDYDSGCALVTKAFAAFSEELGEFAEHAFRSRWVEAENRSGKRQGAFCTGFPGKRETRVFMTYLNSYDNVATLAHELGHAYHSWVLRDEPVFLQDYPMNLAETASTFAEGVLADQRLKTTESRWARLQILDHLLADAVAFLMNIHARFVFEDNFHKERSGGELSAERFSELMLAAQKETYLDALDPEGWYPDFWASKLHFYISGLPFYNFPYTFGYLLSTGLIAVAAEQQGAFPSQYRKLLIATGCMSAEEAVKSTLGYDLQTPEFWNRSLDVVGQRVNQFLELVDRPG